MKVTAGHKFHRVAGFTLVEIMIVVGIIGIIIAIAAPAFLRQREMSRALACQENLKKIDDAKEQYAMDFKLSNGGIVNYPTDLITPPGSPPRGGYIKTTPHCPVDGVYTVQPIGEDPECSISDSNVGFPPHRVPNAVVPTP